MGHIEIIKHGAIYTLHWKLKDKWGAAEFPTYKAVTDYLDVLHEKGII